MASDAVVTFFSESWCLDQLVKNIVSAFRGGVSDLPLGRRRENMKSKER
jgi:hypothetical protein